MKVIVGSDHAGFDLKSNLIRNHPQIDWIDMGPHHGDSVDYVDFADLVCAEVLKTGFLGVLLCGSGQGMAMRANKFLKIRAGLCHSLESVKLAREHNNANVLCMGSRLITHTQAFQIFDSFIKTPFAGGRHLPRVEKLSKTVQTV